MYHLQFNENQARVLIKALDFYSRIGIGQLEEVLNVLLLDDHVISSSFESKENLIKELKQGLFGFPLSASFGIHNEKVPDKYRQSWDVMQVIRHQLWLDNPNHADYTVDAYDPHQSGKEPLPVINRIT